MSTPPRPPGWSAWLGCTWSPTPKAMAPVPDRTVPRYLQRECSYQRTRRAPKEEGYMGRSMMNATIQYTAMITGGVWTESEGLGATVA
jgi:hypothetical protein